MGKDITIKFQNGTSYVKDGQFGFMSTVDKKNFFPFYDYDMEKKFFEKINAMDKMGLENSLLMKTLYDATANEVVEEMELIIRNMMDVLYRAQSGKDVFESQEQADNFVTQLEYNCCQVYAFKIRLKYIYKYSDIQ